MNKLDGLISILKSFSPEKLKRGKKYLRRMYGQQKVPLDLFVYISKFYPDFNSKQIDRKLLFAKFFHEFESPMKRGSNEIRKLVQWVEEFMIYDYLNSPEGNTSKNILLRDLLKKNGLPILFSEKKMEIQNNTVDLPESAAKNALLQENFETSYFYSSKNKLTTGNSELLDSLHYLEIMYALKKSKFQCEILNRANILGEEMIQPSMQIPENRLVRLFSGLNSLFSSPSSEKYLTLKDLFFDSKLNEIAKEDSLIIITYLINYLANFSTLAQKERNREIFEIYNFADRNRLLIENDFIAEQKFFNVLAVSCEVNEFVWAKSFVERYQKFLPLQIKESAIRLAKARLFFEEGKFEDSIHQIRNEKTENIAHALQIKLLNIRNYFELQKEDIYSLLLDNYLNSFHVFLVENKKNIHIKTIEYCRQFLSIFRQILIQKKSKEQLLDYLGKHPKMACYTWIEKKLRDYKSI